ncbi:MAG TPA: hypothetical protein DHN33_10090, partial [Eubacteriaceae bacterium]|nr:hypothetical protein [Eubacteriaceae bacterium]
SSIALTAGNRDEISFIESGISSGLSPVQSVFYQGAYYVNGFYNFITNLSTMREENEALKEQAERYRTELADYQRVKQENETLQSLLDLSETIDPGDSIAASVTGIDPQFGFNVFTINKGSNDGV